MTTANTRVGGSAGPGARPAGPAGSSGPASPFQRWRKRNLTFDRVSFFLVFLVVPFAGYLLFVVSPFVQAGYYSLTAWSGFTDVMPFVGFDNYVKLFQDATFLQALRNNIIFVIVLPTVTLAIAMFFATLVTIGGSTRGNVKGLRGSGFYRVVSFFPYVVPAIVIGLVWAQVYDPNTGILNGLLTGIGLDKFEAFAWLGDIGTARLAVMFVIIWGSVGFYMVLFIAAIKGIPAEIFEAARVDGFGRFRTTIFITVPLVRNTVQTAYIYMGILALDAFVYVAALTPGGGPSNTTLVIPQHLLTTAFTKGQFGYASAMGVILALVTLLYAGLVFGVNKATGGRREVAE